MGRLGLPLNRPGRGWPAQQRACSRRQRLDGDLVHCRQRPVVEQPCRCAGPYAAFRQPEAIAGPAQATVIDHVHYSQAYSDDFTACGFSIHLEGVATGNARVASGRLADLLRRIAAFGLTLARLDLRQDSSRHAAAIDWVLSRRRLGAYHQRY